LGFPLIHRLSYSRTRSPFLSPSFLDGDHAMLSIVVFELLGGAFLLIFLLLAYSIGKDDPSCFFFGQI
jgi:hypothetical protein